MEPLSKQFVVHKHITSAGVHWDWMLEESGTLQTWRVNCPPREVGSEPVRADRIADHDIRFLTYEGPVQQNTGRVQMEDRGYVIFLKRTETQVLFRLEGRILSGCFTFYQEERSWFVRRIKEE